VLLQWTAIASTCWGLGILMCLPAHASSPNGGNCVAYAGAVTGIQIDGNAGLWWSHAAGRYERGQVPKIGAILAFKSYGGMRSGHVAVVSGIVGPREILIDHANWVRGRVTKAMLAVDSSLDNDWTNVKVVSARAQASGARDNPTFGFIYPRSLSADFGTTAAEAPRRHRGPIHISGHPRHKAADAKLAYVY
jgi:surface antigen